METISLGDGHEVRLGGHFSGGYLERSATRIALAVGESDEALMTAEEARDVAATLLRLATAAERASATVIDPGGHGHVRPGRGHANEPEEILRHVAAYLTVSGQRRWIAGATVGEGSRLGKAHVFRMVPAGSLLVVGKTELAEALRKLIAAGAAPGLGLYRLPEERRPVSLLVQELECRPQGHRAARLIRQSPFRWIEEISALRDESIQCAVFGAGPQSVKAVRAAIRSLDQMDAPAITQHVKPAPPARIPEPAKLPGPITTPVPAPPVQRDVRLVHEVATDALRRVIRHLSEPGHEVCTARTALDAGPSLGVARVVRLWPERTLVVAGASPMAEELGKLIDAGAAPGWALYELPPDKTPAARLGVQLWRMTSRVAFNQALDRSGLAWVEEIEAISDEALQEITPRGGPKYVAAVRQAIRSLGPRGTRPPAGETDLSVLADDLMAEVGDTRRQILTEQTFAPRPRSDASLAHELRLQKAQLRQLSRTSCDIVSILSHDPRYAPLRSAAQAGDHVDDEKRPWLAPLLNWLATGQNSQSALSERPSAFSRPAPFPALGGPP